MILKSKDELTPDPVYKNDGFFTISNYKQELENSNIKGINFSLENYIVDSAKMFIAISSLCVPFKSWSGDNTTIAYMSYNPTQKLNVTFIDFSLLGH